MSDSSTTTRWGRTHQFEQQSLLQICRKLHPPYPSVLVTSKIIVWRSLLTVEFFSRACEQQSALLFVRNVANIRFGHEVLRCSSCYHHVQLLKPVHMNYWHVKTECLFLFPVLLLTHWCGTLFSTSKRQSLLLCNDNNVTLWRWLWQGHTT